jgi:predicted kinase
MISPASDDQRPVLYILCGLPFSGKSSVGRAIAARTGSTIVSFDDLYDAHMRALGQTRDTSAVWQAIREMAAQRIAALLRRGVSVVYDNTNFRATHRDMLRALAAESGAQAIIVHLNTPPGVIAGRRAANAQTGQRSDITDADLAYVQGEWEEPGDDEGAIEFRPGIDAEAWLDRLVRDRHDRSGR